MKNLNEKKISFLSFILSQHEKYFPLAKLYYLDINNENYPTDNNFSVIKSENYLADNNFRDPLFIEYLSISPINTKEKNQQKGNKTLINGCIKSTAPEDLHDFFKLQHPSSVSDFFLKKETISGEEIDISNIPSILKELEFKPPQFIRLNSPFLSYELFQKYPELLDNLLFIEFVEFFQFASSDLSHVATLDLLTKNGFSLLDLQIDRLEHLTLPNFEVEFNKTIFINNKKYMFCNKIGQPVFGRFILYKDPLKNRNLRDQINFEQETFTFLSYILYQYKAQNILSEIIESSYSGAYRYKKIMLDQLTKEVNPLFFSFEKYKKSINLSKSYKNNFSVTQNYKPSKLTPPDADIPILISIQILSNSPKDLVNFFQNIEETTIDHKCLEVCVKIDDNDMETYSTIVKQIQKRPFCIKYIKTPPPKKFPDLWKSLDELFAISNKKSYFCLNLSDEMFFVNFGWDEILKKYINLFDDHLFRLRTSMFRNHKYHDIWVCGFSPETSAITTRKWLEISGGWCPCLGPDSFQQCVSFYLSHKDLFNKWQDMRDVVINDIRFGGEAAYVGLKGFVLEKRIAEATVAWFRLFSYEMQLEASRRASKIHCTIYGYKNHIQNFKVKDHRAKKYIFVINAEGEVIYKSNYNISHFRTLLTNFKRKSKFSYFGGGGVDSYKVHKKLGILVYLVTKYPSLRRLRNFFRLSSKP